MFSQVLKLLFCVESKKQTSKGQITGQAYDIVGCVTMVSVRSDGRVKIAFACLSP